MTAASIRYNNPGAMWGGNAIAKRWGASNAVVLNDGLKQGNNIAPFPDKVHGAAAQFDLWRTNYSNMTLKAAITKWSGGNWSAPYMKSLCQATGLTPESVVTVGLLASQQGIMLLKAQAKWEAGMVYPMSDEEWAEAQAMCFKTRAPVSAKAKKTSTVGVTATVAAGGAVAAAQSGSSHVGLILFGILLVAVIVGGAVYWFHHQSGKVQPS